MILIFVGLYGMACYGDMLDRWWKQKQGYTYLGDHKEGFGIWHKNIVPKNADAGVIMKAGTTGVDYCSPLASFEQYWDGDHTSGTNHACESGGTEAGTLSGATVSTDQNHTSDSGSYSHALDCTAANQYLEFNRDSKMTSSEGELDIWFYPTAAATAYCLFEMHKDGNDYVHFVVLTSNKIRIVHAADGAGQNDAYSAGTITANQWNRAQARWHVGSGNLDAQLNSEGWQDDNDAIAAFDSGEATTFCYGEKDSGESQDATIYIDDCYVEATSSRQ